MELEEANSFRIAKYKNYYILRLAGDLNDLKAEEYLAKTLPEVVASGFDLIVNCDYLTKISRGWLRALSVTEQKIREKKKGLRLILVPAEIRIVFKDEGLSRILKSCNNLRDALLELGHVNRKSLDVGFINPFLVATVDVLKIMAQTQSKTGAIYMKKDANITGDVSGVIGLVSESFTGNVMVSFPEKTFLAIMSRIHGETYTAISPDNSDGAGEISNMIFGQAKIVLNEQGYGMKTALPSIIMGKGHSFSSTTKGPTVVVPFESDCGPFYVEISLSDNDAATAAA